MITVKEEIVKHLQKIAEDLTGQDISPNLDRPKDDRHGDYSSNIAMVFFANQESSIRRPELMPKGIKNQEYKSPLELAKKIADKFMLPDSRFAARRAKFMILSRVEAVKPGFINFWLSKKY